MREFNPDTYQLTLAAAVLRVAGIARWARRAAVRDRSSGVALCEWIAVGTGAGIDVCGR